MFAMDTFPFFYRGYNLKPIFFNFVSEGIGENGVA